MEQEVAALRGELMDTAAERDELRALLAAANVRPAGPCARSPRRAHRRRLRSVRRSRRGRVRWTPSFRRPNSWQSCRRRTVLYGKSWRNWAPSWSRRSARPGSCGPGRRVGRGGARSWTSWARWSSLGRRSSSSAWRSSRLSSRRRWRCRRRRRDRCLSSAPVRTIWTPSYGWRGREWCAPNRGCAGRRRARRNSSWPWRTCSGSMQSEGHCCSGVLSWESSWPPQYRRPPTPSSSANWWPATFSSRRTCARPRPPPRPRWPICS